MTTTHTQSFWRLEGKQKYMFIYIYIGSLWWICVVVSVVPFEKLNIILFLDFDFTSFGDFLHLFWHNYLIITLNKNKINILDMGIFGLVVLNWLSHNKNVLSSGSGRLMQIIWFLFYLFIKFHTKSIDYWG